MEFEFNNNKKNDSQKFFIFSYDKFDQFYKDGIRAIINREQEDDKDIFKKIKGNKKGKKGNFKTYQRNGFFLSQKILDYYMNISNNNYKELNNTFKLVKCEY